MSDTNNLNTNITVSREGIATFVNDNLSNTPNNKPLISVETEAEILKKIEKHCNTWNNISTGHTVCIIIFGLSAVSTSVLVSIYTGQEKLISVAVIKVLACISTISLAILTAFNLVSNACNARTAWRTLNAAMMMYKAGSMSIQELIEQYQKGENQIGNLSFSYGTNGDKPATFSHDIKGKSDEQREIQKDEEAKNKKSEDADEQKADSDLENVEANKQIEEN